MEYLGSYGDTSISSSQLSATWQILLLGLFAQFSLTPRGGNHSIALKTQRFAVERRKRRNGQAVQVFHDGASE